MVDDRNQFFDEDEKLAAGEADWRACPETPFPRVVIKGMTPTVMRRIKREVEEILAESNDYDDLFLQESPFVRIAPLLEKAFQKLVAEEEQEELEGD